MREPQDYGDGAVEERYERVTVPITDPHDEFLQRRLHPTCRTGDATHVLGSMPQLRAGCPDRGVQHARLELRQVRPKCALSAMTCPSCRKKRGEIRVRPGLPGTVGSVEREDETACM